MPHLYYIKNMVCHRCILAVQDILNKLNIPYEQVLLGEVTANSAIPEPQLQQLSQQLSLIGFELLDDSRQRIIESIKTIIIKAIHYHPDKHKYKFSEIISGELHKDYSYLSNMFSGVEGITIEKYIINQKIEKAKELMIYDELNLSQIADELGYSSVAHLSNQFKKITGLSPSHFKKIGTNRRVPLDKV